MGYSAIVLKTSIISKIPVLGAYDMKYVLIIKSLAFLLVLAYCAVRVDNFTNVFPRMKQTDDTPSYMRASNFDFWDTRAFRRAPTYPLVISVFQGNLRTVTIFQLAMSIVAWSWFSFVIFKLFHIKLFSILGLAGVLVFSLNKHIIGWDNVIQTESLSISFMVILLGLWLYLMQYPQKFLPFILMVFFGALWAFLRDTNAYVILMFGLLTLIATTVKKLPKQYVFLAAAYMLIFAINYSTFVTGQRWVYSFQNILAKNILSNTEALDFFEKCGMPTTQPLLDFARARSTIINESLSRDPEFESYRLWRDKDGRACYTQWLLSNPLDSMISPIRYMGSYLYFKDIDRFFQNQFKPVLHPRVAEILYPEKFSLPVSVILLTMSSAMTLAHIKKSKKLWLWLCILISAISLYPQFFLIYHGDTNDTARHAMTTSVQLFLLFWISIGFSLEFLINRLIIKIKNSSQGKTAIELSR
jgi:hypothetical protein